MTVRLQASLQSLVFVVLLAATLFGAAGGVNFIEFWLYVVVVAAVSGLALADLGPDLMQERMRPGGRRVGLRFLPMVALIFLHWAVAGIQRHRPGASGGHGIHHRPLPLRPAPRLHGGSRRREAGTGPLRLQGISTRSVASPGSAASWPLRDSGVVL